jgi:hypothetical protein
MENPANGAPAVPVHDVFIKQALPAWITAASTSQRQAYSESALRRQRSEQAAARVLQQFKPPAVFAKPLLEAELKRAYQLDIDVDEWVLVRLVNQSGVPLSKQYWPQQQPLLQAALQNFKAHETVAGGLDRVYLMRPEGIVYHPIENGALAGNIGFALDRESFLGISAEQFAALCRDLDLGKRYLEHFHQVFQPLSSRAPVRDEQQAEIALALVFKEQDSLENLAHIAHIKGDISDSALTMLMAAARNHQEPAQWHGQAVRYQILRLLATPLHSGTVLWRAMLFERGDGQPGYVAYLPADPDTPLKEYASVEAFANALRERLRDPVYRTHFESYVSAEQRAAFTERLVNTLSPRHGGTFVDPYHRADPQADIGLRRQTVAAGLTRLRYEQLLQSIAHEARQIVVPSSDQDNLEAAEQVAAWFSTAMTVLNLAAFSVPAVGALMAGLGAIQLLDEVFTGIDDWRHGQTREALAHLMSVAENVALIGVTVGAGVAIARSPWVEAMVPVVDGRGKSRLWDRSLVSYRSSVQLPAALEPNAAGQYQYEGRVYGYIDDTLCEQSWDAERRHWKVVHPSDPLAYQPVLEHNGEGAWRHVHERLEQWSEERLLRRLGEPTRGLDDAQLIRARQAAGVSHDDLRRLHDTRAPLPACLADSLSRLQADRAVEQFVGQLRRAEAVLPYHLHAPALLVEVPGWPRELVIELAPDTAAGKALRYGRREDPQAVTLHLTRQQLVEGRMVHTVLEQMTEAQRLALLGDAVEAVPARRAEALCERLGDYAHGRRAELFEHFLKGRGLNPGPLAQPVLKQFPGLTPALAEAIVAGARSAEREVLQRGRVPLRLAEQARQHQRELRLSRAMLGVQGYTGLSSDSQKLLLGALGRQPGWPADVHLQLRIGSLTAVPIASLGDPTASLKCTIVHTGEHWQPFDSQGLQLRTGTSLAEAVLGALPDAQRHAMGYTAAQGADLQAKLAATVSADRPANARLLGQASAEPWFRWPSRRADGRLGYELSGRGWINWINTSRTSVDSRLRLLYPALDEARLQALKSQWAGAPELIVTRLETEYRVLSSSLQAWASQVETSLEAEVAQARLANRQEIARRIEAAWRREGDLLWAPGSLQPGTSLDLNGLAGGKLPVLVANMAHVYEVGLSHMGAVEGDFEAFLPAFRQARDVDLSSNRLTRIPSSMAQLSRLRMLKINQNQLQWLPGLLEPLKGLPIKGLSMNSNALALTGDGIQALAELSHLRRLALRSNELTLTSGDLQTLSGMRLERVDLKNNQITLDAEGAQALGNFFYLKDLRLSHNPLGRSPDFSRLIDLEYVELSDTGLTEWPTGLLDLMQRRPLRLQGVHLLDNAIGEVPALAHTPFGEASRGSALWGVLIEDEHLSPASRRHLIEIDSPPIGAFYGGEWLDDASPQLLLRVEQLRNEPGSEGLLSALERCVDTADYRAHPQHERERLWQLVRDLTPEPPQPGMADLRAQLYQVADEAERTCGDGRQLVLQQARNLVEVYKVLLHADPGQSVSVLPAVVYSKRLWRLDLVDSCAVRISSRRSVRRALIYPDAAEADALGGAHRPTLSSDSQVLEAPQARLDPLDDVTDNVLEDLPDEAEIRLKLRLLLADSLDLPNPPQGMLYTAPVSPATAKRVEQWVLAQSSTAGLLDWLVRQRYWAFLLERQFPERLLAFEGRWNTGYTALFELARRTPEAVTLPDEVRAVLESHLPDKDWRAKDLAQAVHLTEAESDIANGALDNARDLARQELYRELSEPWVIALQLDQVHL